jgi:hypothetical protein
VADDSSIKPASTTLIDTIGSKFTALSALLTIGGAAASMVFIFGYLSTFDVSLIMVIEYSDLFKFMLIGICIAYIVLFGFSYLMHTFINWHAGRFTNSQFVVIAGATVLFFSVLTVISYHYNYEDRYYQLSRTLTVILGVLSIYFAVQTIQNRIINTQAIIGLSISFAVVVYAIGNTFGIYVRDVSKSHDLLVQRGPEKTRAISDAKLILFTSHHVIVKIGPTIATFPTADVEEIFSSAN